MASRRVLLALAVLAFGFTVAGCSSAPLIGPGASSGSVATTTTATGTTTATLAPCDPGVLTARILAWDAGAGHRTAQVQLTNASASACTVRALSQPQLVDGHGSVMIAGAAPASSATLTVAPGGSIRTEVQDGNYCGPEPVAPVTLAFVLPETGARVVAAAASATDLSGVPPCLGPAGSAGTVEMRAWAP
jgi:hypothetical protein